jgi:NitT/TauT family transport system permease protein
MTTSIMKSARKKTPKPRLWAVALWLIVWQLGSLALGESLLLPSPVAVLRRLAALIVTVDFWTTVGRSALHIWGGFLLSCALAAAAAVAAARCRTVRELLEPLMAVVKAVPVVSFIILTLVWLPTRQLSLFTAALMVFPPVYLNLLEGIQRRDVQLLEMARVFHVPLWRRLRGIDIPQVLPYFRTACSLGLGLCWKAGAAAEVIGLPSGTIGERLYMAKVYLETPDLFAWTAVIVAVSVLFEKLFLGAVDALAGKAGAAWK